jgi:hypothetical protein
VRVLNQDGHQALGLQHGRLALGEDEGAAQEGQVLAQRQLDEPCEEVLELVDESPLAGSPDHVENPTDGEDE